MPLFPGIGLSSPALGRQRHRHLSFGTWCRPVGYPSSSLVAVVKTGALCLPGVILSVSIQACILDIPQRVFVFPRAPI